MSRKGRIARCGLCLIMAGVAIYGMLGLISAAGADGAIALGNPEPVSNDSVAPYNGCIVQFVIVDSDVVDSLVPYIGGGTLLVIVAGLFLVYRKYAGDNNHYEKMVEKW